MDAFPNSVCICICTCMVLIEVWFSFLSVCVLFLLQILLKYTIYIDCLCVALIGKIWWIDFYDDIEKNSILSEFYYNITNCYKYVWVWKSEGMCILYLYAVFFYYYIYIKFYLCIYTSKLFGSSFFLYHSLNIIYSLRFSYCILEKICSYIKYFMFTHRRHCFFVFVLNNPFYMYHIIRV